MSAANDLLQPPKTSVIHLGKVPLANLAFQVGSAAFVGCKRKRPVSLLGAGPSTGIRSAPTTSASSHIEHPCTISLPAVRSRQEMSCERVLGKFETFEVF